MKIYNVIILLISFNLFSQFEYGVKGGINFNSNINLNAEIESIDNAINIFESRNGAHIGGFIAGMTLTPLLKNKDKPIFNKRLSSPWEVKKTQTSDISKTFTHGRKSSLPIFKKPKGSLPRFRR